MMADFVTPRHSAVMERLRRRIELFRQHHNSCESRYEGATLERLELERQQTFALHQRCLQAKAKRSNKHRQPQPSSDQAGQRAQGGGGGGGSAELGDSGGTTAEQSRNSTLIALQETVKRKLESASSPLGRDQVNGFSDGFPPNKKACLDNGTANGSPLDSKLGILDSLSSNGTHGPGDLTDSGEPEFHRKEMKQEPDDILPIMPPSGGGNSNSLFPDLNLNEQEWRELMEELNCSVAYEDIQDILNDGFEDRKDPLDLAPTPGGAAAVGGAAAGGGGQSSQGLHPLDLNSVKSEFSPAPFEQVQDSRIGSPHVRSASSGPPPPHPTSSPVSASSASSPAVAPSQPAPPRQLQPPPNHLLPPGPPVPKDLSPAQQLQQLAAQKQRAQHIQSQMQHKQPPGNKFHAQGPHAHPQAWPQMTNPSQNQLGGPFGMDKPTSPSLYPQEFNPGAQKQLLMPSQPNKGSPKAAGSGYLPGAGGHPNMLGHPAPGPPLSHPPAQGAQTSATMPNYNNTKPLSHFEAGPGLPRPPNTQSQNKAALLSLLRQQQIKQKSNMNFRQHLPHTQDQNSFPAPTHGPGPVNTMTSVPGNGAMAAQPGANAMAGNHGNAAYLSSQAVVAAALKQQQQHQQQILEQQKQQQQYMQRQQLMAEQEKQRQQDQQLQRHLTRPPPQYQDQPGQTANQNPFPQQPVNQFTASSQPMGSVVQMGGPAPGSQRMFTQNPGMMGMNLSQGSVPPGGVAQPPAGVQADHGLSSCGGGGGGAGVDVQQLYNNMNLHPGHPPPQPGLQRQSMGAMSTPYRQNLLAQQQHLKAQPNPAMLKQQQLAATARMPSTMQSSMGGNLPGSMQGAQGTAWQQQLSNQPPSGNAFSNNPNAFHMQQGRIPKMAPGAAAFGTNPGGRSIGVLNPVQQMMQTNMAATQQRVAPNPQSLGQPMSNQQQTQQQQANQNQAVLPDHLPSFVQPQGNGRQGLQCNQGYQVSRTTAQQQQQVSFGYNVASGSFAPESELVDSLLKGQSTQEWIADLDELLASHH